VVKTLKGLFASTRPSQWVKNLAVFAAIFFGGELESQTLLWRTIITFVSFCFAAASTYLFNDVVDSQADLLHQMKRNRPVAAGKISRELASLIAGVFAIVSLSLALLVSQGVFFMLLLYLLVQIAYNLALKKVVLLELLIIAFGFMIRVFAGSFAAGVALSSWLILTVMMVSLFLAVGKRRSEVTLLGPLASSHRSSLSEYPLNLLDGLVYMSATASLITYSLFTFNQPLETNSRLFVTFLPATLASPKWLMVTIPIVVYGFFRYLYLIFEKKEGDSPEKVLLTDRPLLLTVLLWLVVASFIIYLLPST
jgi:4-hydroxybenzoate polyprenyltransferase